MHVVLDQADAFVEPRLVHILEGDIESGESDHMSDAAAHLAGADYAYFAELRRVDGYVVHRW